MFRDIFVSQVVRNFRRFFRKSTIIFPEISRNFPTYNPSVYSLCLFVYLVISTVQLVVFVAYMSLSFLLQTVVFIVFIYSALQLQV